MEPWTITTVYPDGTTEERLSTPEEVAQREADVAAWEQEKADREAAEAQAAADRQAAVDHARSLGFSDSMIAVMFPGLGV